jgi:hypothetical protein
MLERCSRRRRRRPLAAGPRHRRPGHRHAAHHVRARHRTNGPRERRFRVIHTQVIRAHVAAAHGPQWASSPRCSRITPSTTCAGWRNASVSARAGPTRSARCTRPACALLRQRLAGHERVVVHGRPVARRVCRRHPQTLDGEPAGGWFPEERVDVETALRAYTVNNAWVAGEEHEKGMLRADCSPTSSSQTATRLLSRPQSSRTCVCCSPLPADASSTARPLILSHGRHDHGAH